MGPVHEHDRDADRHRPAGHRHPAEARVGGDAVERRRPEDALVGGPCAGGEVRRGGASDEAVRRPRARQDDAVGVEDCGDPVAGQPLLGQQGSEPARSDAGGQHVTEPACAEHGHGHREDGLGLALVGEVAGDGGPAGGRDPEDVSALRHTEARRRRCARREQEAAGGVEQADPRPSRLLRGDAAQVRAEGREVRGLEAV